MASNFLEEFVVGLGFRFEGEDGERYKKQTQQIASSLNALTTAAAAALTALFALSKQAGASAVNADNIAKSFDTSVEALGKWQFAAKKVGVDGNAVIGMLQGLKQASQEAIRTGQGPFRAFQELDVDWQGIASGAVDVSDALDGIIEKAQTLDRATAQSGLRELGIDVKFLDTPITKLRQYMAEYAKFSQQTEKLTKEGRAFADAWDGAAVRLDGLQNMVAERALPTFTKFFEVLEQGLEWLQKDGIPIIDEVVEKLGGWDKVIGGLALIAIPALIGTLGTLGRLLTGITGGFAGASRAAGLFAKGGLAAGAAAGGYIVGGSQRQGNEELSDQVGDFLVNALGLIGLEEGKDFTRTRANPDPNRPGFSQRQDGWAPSTTYLNNKSMQDDYEAARREHPEDYPVNSPADKAMQDDYEAARREHPEDYPRGGQSNDFNALRDAIIGRESAGDTNAVSPKGARGLMQLMPDTAEEVAGKLGVPYDKERLTQDPEYNKKLGTAYLQMMLDRYTGSEGLAVAAYNAGPGKVDDWLKQNGDPRNGGISMQDWVQQIPYKETRDYAQNVLADKASILPPTYQPGDAQNPGVAPPVSNKTINNTFNGLKQSEIENLLRQAEDEQNTLMGNEAKDTIVR